MTLPLPRFLRVRYQRLLGSPIIGGSAANLYGTALLIVAQIITVPGFSRAFGLHGYGVWLLLTTIPSYLLLTDVGFTTTATNDIAMRVGAEDFDGAQSTFQTYSLFLAGIAVILALCAVTVIPGLAVNGLWSSDISAHWVSISILILYGSVGLMSMLPPAALSATGHYTIGQIVTISLGVAETFITVAVALLSRNLVYAAAAMLIVRSIIAVALYVLLRRRVPYLWIGTASASMVEFRRLLPAAMANLAVPASLALTLQGTVVVVGSVLGPAAVGIFSPVRTVSRLMLQVTGSFVRAITPRLAMARGSLDVVAERRLRRFSAVLIVGTLIPAAIGFALLGRKAISLWTGGLIVPPESLVALVGLAAVFHGIWFYGMMLLSATDQHRRVAKLIPIAAVIGFATAPFMCRWLGLTGAALAVCATDGILAVAVIRATPRS